MLLLSYVLLHLSRFAVADSSSQVVDLLVASLIIDGTPVPRKIARLHLVSGAFCLPTSPPQPLTFLFRRPTQLLLLPPERLGLPLDARIPPPRSLRPPRRHLPLLPRPNEGRAIPSPSHQRASLPPSSSLPLTLAHRSSMSGNAIG